MNGNNVHSLVSRPSRSLSVKFPSDAKRSIFIIRDRSATFSFDSSVADRVRPSRFSSEGRKKGAFSGAFGASVGLFRCYKGLAVSVCYDR